MPSEDHQNGRVDPLDLTTLTPSKIPRRPSLHQLFTFGFMVAAGVLPAGLIDAFAPIPGRFFLVTALPTFYFGWRPTNAYFRRTRAGLTLERMHERRLRDRRAVTESPTRISGVRPPSWISVDKKHDGHYRLCIAKLYENGAGSQVGYHDGTTQTIHAQQNVNRRRFASGAGRTTTLSRAAAEILEPILSEVAKDGGRIRIEHIRKMFEAEHDPSPVRHALLTAVLWGLLDAASPIERPALYALLSDPADGHLDENDLLVRLSPAGRIWLDCSSKAIEEAARRARMAKNRSSKNVFNGAVGAVFQGDHTGDTTINQYGGSAADIEAALKELLANPDFRARSDLSREREIIGNAVASGHVDSRPVRSAVGRVLRAAKPLVEGVVGNAIYGVLTHFAGVG